MPKLIFLSREVLWDSSSNAPYDGVVPVLKQISNQGHVVGVISSRPRPSWLSGELGFIEFFKCGFIPSRKSGKPILSFLEQAKEKGIEHGDLVVLGATDADFQMAVNSQTLLIRCDWSKDRGESIRRYGVPISKPSSLPFLVDLLKDENPWFWTYNSAPCDIYALTKAGTLDEADAGFVRVCEELRACLKQNVERRSKEFKLHLLSSLCATNDFRDVDHWAYYPSSDSSNQESEVMASFCELARVTFKRRTRGPLLIRHKPSSKRHQGNGNRQDPTSQIETVKLNEAYRGRLEGKKVVVMDDYTTHGVSFATSAALLQKAGASKVMCVAMGKFGNTARWYDIEINQDPYKPITAYKVGANKLISGQGNMSARADFREKFSKII